MIRPTVAHVSLDALRSNCLAIAGHLAERTPPGAKTPGVIAVVKANAYGHGAAPVALAIEECGVSMLACADIEEGVLVRRAGVTAPILVFGALSVSDLAGIFDYDLIPTVSTPSAARALQTAAAALGRRLKCHVKIDTGMNRLGFRCDNLHATLPDVAASPNLDIEGVYTHFATANDLEHPLFDEQRRRFEHALTEMRAIGIRPRLRHAANSAAMLRDRGMWFDCVRPGLLLYGVVPPPLATEIRLRPVMTLRSRLVAVKGLRTGECVGYGARFTAERPMNIAIVPAGYADGLDMRLAGRGMVLVRGRRVPIVGAVSMDMIAVDVTDLSVEIGDEVVFIGEQDGARMDVGEMAATIGTIPYEILCRIGSRIERVYNQVAGVQGGWAGRSS